MKNVIMMKFTKKSEYVNKNVKVIYNFEIQKCDIQTRSLDDKILIQK